jgi:predicted flavoprotein YhiN
VGFGVGSRIGDVALIMGDGQIVVVGAGAAGMLAAGRAAELGAKVLLLEKMERPGKKVLITGNGRCNLSNSADVDIFIDRFGRNGRFLYRAFNRFFRDDLLALLRRYGVEFKTEPGGKIYPVTDDARDVVRALQHYIADGGVTIRFGVRTTRVVVEDGAVSGVETSQGIFAASAVVVACGGASHPETGSSGDGFDIAAALGHRIVRPRPALVPLVVKDAGLIKQMQGVSLRNVRVTAFQKQSEEINPSVAPGADTGRGISGKRARPPVIESRAGDVIFTHFGLSGPVMLEMSLAVVDALEKGPVSISIDLVPGKDRNTLRKDLQHALDTHSKGTSKNVIKHLLPPKLVEPFVTMAGVTPGKASSQITSEERERLLDLLKSLRFDIQGAHSMAAAQVTAGGVSLDEIDPRTMASKLVPGLFFCGEVMDIDAASGGFNLQAAFSTGYLAGESAAYAVKGL